MLKCNYGFLAAIIGFNLVFNVPILSVVALEPVVIQKRTENFIVKIGGNKGGTGFFVKKNNDIYTILTNRHVVNNPAEYIITTSDGQSYRFNASNIRLFPGLDLAEVEIKSDKNYSIATLNNKSTLIRGSVIFSYGWNAVGDRLTSRDLQWLEGKVTGLNNSSSDGYTLGYTLTLVRGLSGSPLLNEEGEVVGIYGSGEQNSIGLGIPIATYQNYADTAKIRPVTPPRTPIITNPSEDIQSGGIEHYSDSGQLQFWKFAPSQNKLEFRTTSAVQPQAILLFNPTRLIIDLPNISFSQATITDRLSGGYTSLRVGQFDDNTTRLSLELEPGMNINPKRVKFVGENPADWYVIIPTPEKGRVIENVDK
jgi:Trypsin-like peptidase domain/AMIN domain